MQTTAADVMSDYIGPKEAAKALRVHPYTLRRWRSAQYGPMPVRVGGRVLYRVSDIQKWLSELGASNAKDA